MWVETCKEGDLSCKPEPGCLALIGEMEYSGGLDLDALHGGHRQVIDDRGPTSLIVDHFQFSLCYEVEHPGGEIRVRL